MYVVYCLYNVTDVPCIILFVEMGAHISC